MTYSCINNDHEYFNSVTCQTLVKLEIYFSISKLKKDTNICPNKSITKTFLTINSVSQHLAIIRRRRGEELLYS
jgi:hypothetical protein